MTVHVEVMIPLVTHVNELRMQTTRCDQVAEEVMAREGIRVDHKFGTMIETPRGALTAGELAKHAEFFSFGTNDLTQMTFGFSRDDAEGKFLHTYVERGILPQNPFQSLDQAGVGKLMAMAVEGRQGRSPRHRAGHLRRARRRSGFDRVLPSRRAQVRELLALTACPWRAWPRRRPPCATASSHCYRSTSRQPTGGSFASGACHPLPQQRLPAPAFRRYNPSV